MFHHPAWAVQLATVGAQQLPKLSELSQLEVFHVHLCHPVVRMSHKNLPAAALGVVDRPALSRWLRSLWQPDGSFVMHVGGEVDIRGVYCALSVARLTGVYAGDMFRGTELWVARWVVLVQITHCGVQLLVHHRSQFHSNSYQELLIDQWQDCIVIHSINHLRSGSRQYKYVPLYDTVLQDLAGTMSNALLGPSS